MIIIFKSTSSGTGYAAIGWRPKSATKQCQAYPKLHDKDPRSLWLADEKSADPEAEAEGESEPESEGKSAYAESESEPEG